MYAGGEREKGNLFGVALASACTFTQVTRNYPQFLKVTSLDTVSILYAKLDKMCGIVCRKFDHVSCVFLQRIALFGYV